jgi:NCS2 family nucleobase:cation symporter-2
VHTLSRVDFDTGRRNVYIVAATLAVSLLPTFAPTLFKALPGWVQPFLHSSILLSCMTSVGLNPLFNGIPRDEAHGSAKAHAMEVRPTSP